MRLAAIQRWLLAALALLELAAALALQTVPTDSPAATANAFAIVFLGLIFATVVWRRPRLPAWLVCMWLLLGLVRAIPLFGGRPGWLLNQSISATGQLVSSQTLVRTVDFGVGAAAAHLVNDWALVNTPVDPKHLPLSVTAAAYVRGSGRLTIASSAPATVRLGSQVLFDSSPPPGAPPGTVLTPNGPKSLDDIRRELRQAGYNGPTDDASVAVAYIRTSLSGGWQVDLDAPAGDQLMVDVAPQDVSAASLQLRLSNLTPLASPAPGPFGQLMAKLSWSLDLTAVALAIVSGALVAWRFVAVRSSAWRIRLALGLAVALIYAAPSLADWAANANQLAVLSRGDDWLTHEALARNIRGGSLLMLTGNPVGHAQPFYAQALYPYVLALGHFAFGEPVQAMVLMQIAIISIVVTLAVLLMPPAPWSLVGLLLVAAGGIATEWYGLATFLLSENLFLLVLAALLLTVAYADAKPTNRQLALISLLLGLAVLTRTTAWLAVPFVVCLVCWVPGAGIDWRRVALAVGPVVLLAVLIPARNLVATGFPTPFPSSLGINVFQGFVPPGRQITTEPWLTWAQTYGRDWVASVEAVVNAPKDVAALFVSKVAYVLGFPRSMGRTDVPLIYFPVFFSWVLALPSLLSAGHSRLARVALALALTHAFALVLIYPNVYYYRLVLPGMLPLAIWDALGITLLAQGLPEPSWLGRQLKRAWCGSSALRPAS